MPSTARSGSDMLRRLGKGSPVHEAVPTLDGLMLLPVAGHAAGFDALVREAMARNGEGFVIFVIQTPAGTDHAYAAAHVVPLNG